MVRRVLLSGLAWLALVPAAQADTLSAHGSFVDKGWTYVVNVDAQSGPLGESATGSYDWQSFDENGVLREHWGGEVTCLQMRGHLAAVAGNLTIYTEPQHDPNPGFWVSFDDGTQDKVSWPGFPSGSSLSGACNTFDARNVLTSGSVAVQDDQPDTVAPVVTISGLTTEPASSPAGGWASFTASATDNLDGQRPVACDNSWSNVYPIGTTHVTCWAYDLNGNRGEAAIDVHIKGATEQIADLRAFVDSLGLPQGTQKSLAARLDGAAQALSSGDNATACSSLAKFITDVQKLTAKKVTAADIARMTGDAGRIETVIPC